MLGVPSAGDAQQETTEERSKQKQGRPERLRDYLVQTEQYAWYGQSKKARTCKPNDTPKDVNFVLEETEDTEDLEDNNKESDLEYQKVVEEFLENLKINLTTVEDVKSKYNKLTSAEQENWSQDQYNLNALLRLSPDTI
ncbi:hypothetical protein MMC22_001809 [Lobaria immixta]|nr:hypothetical protein [Lobaria immixta]